MKQDDLLLVDTNVLVYAMDGTSQFHVASRAVLDRAQSANANLCVTSQNLAEFFSLVTNASRVVSPQSIDDALAAIESLISLPGLRVLPTPVGTETLWIDLCRKHPVKGARIFDLQLVATMSINGVERISTFDSDFRNVAGITVEVP